MKINSHSKKRKLVIIVLVVAIIVVTGLLVFTVLKNQGFFDGDKDSKENSIESNSNYDTTPGDPGNIYKENEKPINDPQQNNNSQPSEISGFITSANVSGSNLIIRTQINELLNGGSCQLILQNSGSIITKTSEIIDSASTASCYGFDVPISELYSGTWQIKIVVSSNARTGIITGEVNI